jgi:hypothetical protein
LQRWALSLVQQSSLIINKNWTTSRSMGRKRRKVIQLIRKLHCSLTPITCIDWLQDKTTGAPFALPALYHPRSKMPLDIWYAGKSNTNGVEQSHRCANRDGTSLSLLGGIEHGRVHDFEEWAGYDLKHLEGINERYQPHNANSQVSLSLKRKGKFHQIILSLSSCS